MIDYKQAEPATSWRMEDIVGWAFEKVMGERNNWRARAIECEERIKELEARPKVPDHPWDQYVAGPDNPLGFSAREIIDSKNQSIDMLIRERDELTKAQAQLSLQMSDVRAKNTDLEQANRILKEVIERKPHQFYTYDERAWAWATDTFGKEPLNLRERALRFLEEALELAQACKLTTKDVTNMTAYTFNRPVGFIEDEIGGTVLTLSLLAKCMGMDVIEKAEACLASAERRKEQVRLKHSKKPANIRASVGVE